MATEPWFLALKNGYGDTRLKGILGAFIVYYNPKKLCRTLDLNMNFKISVLVLGTVWVAKIHNG